MVKKIQFYYIKQQWNTKWAFARKHDIFTFENTKFLFKRSKISQKWAPLGGHVIPTIYVLGIEMKKQEKSY